MRSQNEPIQLYLSLPHLHQFRQLRESEDYNKSDQSLFTTLKLRSEGLRTFRAALRTYKGIRSRRAVSFYACCACSTTVQRSMSTKSRQEERPDSPQAHISKSMNRLRWIASTAPAPISGRAVSRTVPSNTDSSFARYIRIPVTGQSSWQVVEVFQNHFLTFGTYMATK